MTGELGDIEKLAVESVTSRQRALLDLMEHTDRRAQQFVVAYVGLIGAALVLTSRPNGLPPDIVVPLLIYVMLLVMGVLFGWLATRTVEITLPGRKPSFWQWARRNNICSERAISAWLSEAELNLDKDGMTQKIAANHLSSCSKCGVAAVLWAATCLVFRAMA